MFARFSAPARGSLTESAARHAPRPEPPAPEKAAARRTELASLHRAVGNASLGRLLTAAGGGRPLIGQPGDSYEREAEQIAAGASSWRGAALGTHLGGIRVHADGAAAEIAGRLSARAATIGQDIFFGAGQFRPGSPEGRRLLAHEAAHAAQQRDAGSSSRVPLIQRQPTAGAEQAPITATTILPLPVGSRVALNRIMDDALFSLLAETQPDLGAALRAVDRRVAMVKAARDDLVAATVAEPITLPGQGGGASTTYRDLTLSLRRADDGAFTLSLSARAEGQPGAVTLFERPNLTPRREGRDIVLSSGTATAPVPELRIGPGAAPGQTRVEAYSAPYLDQMPAIARRLAPARTDLIQLTALPDAPAGSAREQAIVADLASRVASARRLPSQQIVAGGGVGFARAAAPLFAAAWQMNFRPIAPVAGFLQIPFEVQIQYVPPASVLGSISSGVQGSLAPVNVPVNLRLLAGLGGGTVPGAPTAPGAAPPLLPAFGPTAGVGAGVELGAWRVDARWEHLFNLVSSGPSVDTLGVRFGRAF